MPTSYPLISILKPCHVGWENMTPNERGAHCSVCNKTVWDFTDKTPDEIRNILIRERANKPCGQFRAEHVTPIIDIEVPLNLLRQERISRLSRFAIVALVVFGTSLFNFITVNGQTVDSVRVVNADSAITQQDPLANPVMDEVVIVFKRHVYEKGLPAIDDMLYPQTILAPRGLNKMVRAEKRKKKQAD